MNNDDLKKYKQLKTQLRLFSDLSKAYYHPEYNKKGTIPFSQFDEDTYRQMLMELRERIQALRKDMTSNPYRRSFIDFHSKKSIDAFNSGVGYEAVRKIAGYWTNPVVVSRKSLFSLEPLTNIAIPLGYHHEVRDITTLDVGSKLRPKVIVSAIPISAPAYPAFSFYRAVIASKSGPSLEYPPIALEEVRVGVHGPDTVTGPTLKNVAAKLEKIAVKKMTDLINNPREAGSND